MILNTDIPATRPVDLVCELFDEDVKIVNDGIKLVVDELSIVIITVTGGDLILIFHIINSEDTIHSHMQ